MRPTTAARLTILPAVLALTAGCGSDPEPTMDGGRDGAVAAVTAFAEALASGDGPGACAHLAPSAQRALERKQGSGNCIDAVARAAEGDPVIPSVEADDVELDGSEATVEGAGGAPLADLFGAESLRLHREDERWLIR